MGWRVGAGDPDLPRLRPDAEHAAWPGARPEAVVPLLLVRGLGADDKGAALPACFAAEGSELTFTRTAQPCIQAGEDMSHEAKQVPVNLKRLAELLIAEAELAALNAAGVDSWEGYGDALDTDFMQVQLRIATERDDGTLTAGESRNGPPHSPWIHFKDAYPPEDTLVLLTDHGGEETKAGCWEGGNAGGGDMIRSWYVGGDYYDGDVGEYDNPYEYWMPIPDLPADEE